MTTMAEYWMHQGEQRAAQRYIQQGDTQATYRIAAKMLATGEAVQKVAAISGLCLIEVKFLSVAVRVSELQLKSSLKNKKYIK